MTSKSKICLALSLIQEDEEGNRCLVKYKI
jgi:hypothetical protein